MTTVFHEGELAVQARAGEEMMAERNGAIISHRVIGGALPFLRQQSMAVLAFEDVSGLLWASVLFGPPGFLSSADGTVVEFDLRQTSTDAHDALWPALQAGNLAAGMLVIDLGTRRRIRINGQLSQPAPDQLRLEVRESYPNCPKYITRRTLRTVATDPRGADSFAEGTVLPSDLSAALRRADTLFIGTGHHERGMDASHRGGAPGYIQVLDSRTLRIPDYPGNGMFNTLGNLEVDPRAAITVPDFAGGNLLQLSGTAQTEWHVAESDAATGGTERFLRFHVEAWKRLTIPAGVITELLDYSPFNPTAAQEDGQL